MNRNKIKYALPLFVFLLLFPQVAFSDITCGTTISSSGTYTLTADKTCSGTWVTISAANVTINGGNHEVTYGDSSAASGIIINNGNTGLTIYDLTLTQGGSGERGIYALSASIDDLTIHDCTFNMEQSPEYSAVKQSNTTADNVSIYNNTFNLNPSSSGQVWGLYFDATSTAGCEIYNNTVTMGSNVDIGRPAFVRLEGNATSVNRGAFHDNTVTINGSMTYAWVGWSVDYWDVYDNNVTLSSSANNSKGFQCDGGSDYNRIYSNTITINSTNTSSASYGVRIRFGSDYNEVYLNTIDVSGTTGTYASYGVSLGADQATPPTDAPNDNKIYRNTITGSGSSTPLQLYEDSFDNYIYCNTLINNSGDGLHYYSPGSLSGLRFSHNDYTVSGYAIGMDTGSQTNSDIVFCSEIVNGSAMDSSDVDDDNNKGGWSITAANCNNDCGKEISLTGGSQSLTWGSGDKTLTFGN